MRVHDGALALREAGHEVYTPGLPGIGERTHLTSPQGDLTTHVTDVANTILYEDLSDIVLLGYSYGDMVVTGALEHVADHVTLLVYLDAFLPRAGDSLNDLARASYSRGRPAPARNGSPRLRAGRSTTRARPPDKGSVEYRTLPAASASRSGCASHWRITRSPAPISKPWTSRAPRQAHRRGPAPSCPVPD
ncbi:alpha/beta fold hydrolase [Streptomyces mirabilis]|uniref:alpha/beta fold hydrolase n=1 Tax=Streptomyces mirabilis TaxID=68239 RepID=UPI0033DF6F25